MDNNICISCYEQTFVEYFEGKDTCKGEYEGGPFCKNQFEDEYPLDREMSIAKDRYYQLKAEETEKGITAKEKQYIYILTEEDITLKEYNKYNGKKTISKLQFISKLMSWTDFCNKTN